MIFVVVLIGFFMLCALYVTWCDRIAAPDGSTVAAVEPEMARGESIEVTA
ncbi:MAG TPA: hypothetical protein PKV27_04550 [Ilumatobacteraceae bacterium]|nr:hypothetical protein [Ilumatobacteraceae bacterium]